MNKDPLLRWYIEHGICIGCRKESAMPGKQKCPECLYKQTIANIPCSSLTSALEYIQKLEKERNALLADLREADMTMCNHCAYFVTSGTQGKCDGYCWCCGGEDCPCNTCDDNSNWKWRGVQECE